jgi:hypothetical protein
MSHVAFDGSLPISDPLMEDRGGGPAYGFYPGSGSAFASIGGASVHAQLALFGQLLFYRRPSEMLVACLTGNKAECRAV